MTEQCKIPPPNWRCTRKPGHEGPCAAIYDGPFQVVELDEYGFSFVRNILSIRTDGAKTVIVI